jgi:hypothetical protein
LLLEQVLKTPELVPRLQAALTPAIADGDRRPAANGPAKVARISAKAAERRGSR